MRLNSALRCHLTKMWKEWRSASETICAFFPSQTKCMMNTKLCMYGVLHPMDLLLWDSGLTHTLCTSADLWNKVRSLHQESCTSCLAYLSPFPLSNSSPLRSLHPSQTFSIKIAMPWHVRSYFFRFRSGTRLKVPSAFTVLGMRQHQVSVALKTELTPTLPTKLCVFLTNASGYGMCDSCMVRIWWQIVSTVVLKTLI